MKWIKSLGISLTLMLIVGACLKQPDYSVVPDITNEDIYFGRNHTTGFDSLVLSLNFKDGDGDLGLDDELDSGNLTYETPLYSVYFDDGVVRPTTVNNYKLPQTFRVENGQLAIGQYYLSWKTKRTVPAADTLPALNCTSWEEFKTGDTVTDTLYIQQNLNYFNFFADLYIKQNDGTFLKFDGENYFGFPLCNVITFKGRFKDLSSQRGVSSPIEGVIHYSIRSSAFLAIFSIKTLKMKYYIQDRALHKSNVVETKEFTLSSITR